ncbi:hypothetical protein NQ314_011251, partial [Rhamnusium bicolor]
VLNSTSSFKECLMLFFSKNVFLFRCQDIKYRDDLPSASIVVCFYNEHFRTLLRTVHSILNRTPGQLLNEILLIDDYSNIPNLHEDVAKYIKEKSLTKVKLLKPERREGLVRARLFGARRAQGKVLVFLDSHIEVNVGWIEPLLSRIREKQTNVVMPIIDIINADTFTYSSSPLVRGGFNWGLHFKWEEFTQSKPYILGTLDKKEDFVKPIKSPTMAGGLFTIDKKYFTDIGEYDAGMNIWGGENLEISFRIWMCGGSLELIPCSRVGHIFRHRRPYGSPDGQDTMLHNSLRVAYVWMDDYKEYFLSQRKDSQNIDFGDISSRLQLRRELKCHDFDWYLKNVYPELTLPTDDEDNLKKKWSAIEHDKYQPWHSRKRNYLGQYHIKLSNTSLCIQSSTDFKTKGSSLILKPCVRSKSQMWFATDKNELVLAQLLCLQAGKLSPILYKCHEMGEIKNGDIKEEGQVHSENTKALTYFTSIAFELNGRIVQSICECAAGKGPKAVCKHMACVCYAILRFKEHSEWLIKMTPTKNKQKMMKLNYPKKAENLTFEIQKCNVTIRKRGNMCFDPRPANTCSPVYWSDIVRNRVINYCSLEKTVRY